MIIQATQTPEITFEHIDYGDAFWADGKLYLKTDFSVAGEHILGYPAISNLYYNAVSLLDGFPASFDDICQVDYADIKIVDKK